MGKPCRGLYPRSTPNNRVQATASEEVVAMPDVYTITEAPQRSGNIS